MIAILRQPNPKEARAFSLESLRVCPGILYFCEPHAVNHVASTMPRGFALSRRPVHSVQREGKSGIKRAYQGEWLRRKGIFLWGGLLLS